MDVENVHRLKCTNKTARVKIQSHETQVIGRNPFDRTQCCFFFYLNLRRTVQNIKNTLRVNRCFQGTRKKSTIVLIYFRIYSFASTAHIRAYGIHNNVCNVLLSILYKKKKKCDKVLLRNSQSENPFGKGSPYGRYAPDKPTTVNIGFFLIRKTCLWSVRMHTFFECTCIDDGIVLAAYNNHRRRTRARKK